MLDIGRTNAQTTDSLIKGMTPAQVRKRDSFQFGWKLAKMLIVPHLRSRRLKPGIQSHIKNKIDTILARENVPAGAPHVGAPQGGAAAGLGPHGVAPPARAANAGAPPDIAP